MNAPTDHPALNNTHAPLQGAVWIPTQLLRPNRWNRKRFDPKRMAELTENVRKHDVLEPILIRRIEGAKAGEPLYEIIAGERRWRASMGAGYTVIPALLRTATDYDVIELLLMENVHREDLHPLDEAQSYHDLLGKPGWPTGVAGVEAIADLINKSTSHVYQRLKLLELGPAGREAMLADKLPTGVALAVARLARAEDQAEATAHLVKGWGGEPYTHRTALDYLQKTFMLRLEKAQFDVKAVYQVAGPCSACTKRTGANPGLFDDVSSTDMCQDRTCFDAKTEAAHQATLQAARDAGHKVVGGDEAKALLPVPNGQPVGHQFFDKPCPALTDSKKPLRELLGLAFRGVLVLDHPTTETAIAIVPDDKVKKALKVKGLLRQEPTPATSSAPKLSAEEDVRRYRESVSLVPEAPKPLTDAQVRAAKATRAAELFGHVLFKRLHEEIGRGALPLEGLRQAVNFVHSGGAYESADLIYTTHGWPLPTLTGIDDDLRARIRKADGQLLGQLLIEAVIVDDLTAGMPLSEMHDVPALELADFYGVDLQVINDQADMEASIEIDGEQRKRMLGSTSTEPATPTTALAAALKAPKAKATAAVKYRDPATGCTWSGRGLQPKWLKVAIDRGARLADFEAAGAK